MHGNTIVYARTDFYGRQAGFNPVFLHFLNKVIVLVSLCEVHISFNGFLNGKVYYIEIKKPKKTSSALCPGLESNQHILADGRF